MQLDLWDDIHEFHNKFNVPFRPTQRRPNRGVVQYRVKFMLEELEEFVQAAKKDDLVQMTDALVDLVYVAMGTAWMLNLPFPAAWIEVHSANMRKERAKADGDSKRGTSLDIIKPKDWQPPCLSKFFCDAEIDMKSPGNVPEFQLDTETFINELKGREQHEQDSRSDTA